MATITLSVSEDIRKKMKRLDQVNWSSIARKAVISEIKEIERKEKLRALLKKEEKDLDWTVELGCKMKQNRAEELRKKGLIR